MNQKHGAARCMSTWHEALGAEGSGLLGGVHLCRDSNPLSPPTHEWLYNEHNNYMHKVRVRGRSPDSRATTRVNDTS